MYTSSLSFTKLIDWCSLTDVLFSLSVFVSLLCYFSHSLCACTAVLIDQFDNSKISCRNVAVQRGLKKVGQLLFVLFGAGGKLFYG